MVLPVYVATIDLKEVKLWLFSVRLDNSARIPSDSRYLETRGLADRAVGNDAVSRQVIVGGIFLSRKGQRHRIERQGCKPSKACLVPLCLIKRQPERFRFLAILRLFRVELYLNDERDMELRCDGGFGSSHRWGIVCDLASQTYSRKHHSFESR